MQNQTDTAIRDATTTDLVARRAYELWEQEGCTHGNDLRHWFEAERQLRSTPPPAAEGNPAYPSKKERDRIVADNVGRNEPVAKIPADALRANP
ncbi:MAG: DUF2934 domain-containing protein [Opitutaceae bacterium]